MITVTVISPEGRDEVECEDPAEAIFAGQTLFDDACDANPYQGYRSALLVRFSVAGKTVRLLEGVRP